MPQMSPMVKLCVKTALKSCLTAEKQVWQLSLLQCIDLLAEVTQEIREEYLQEEERRRWG